MHLLASVSHFYLLKQTSVVIQCSASTLCFWEYCAESPAKNTLLLSERFKSRCLPTKACLVGAAEGFSEIFLWQRGGELDVGETMCHRLKQTRPDEDAGTKRGGKSAVSVSWRGGGSDCLIRRIKRLGQTEQTAIESQARWGPSNRLRHTAGCVSVSGQSCEKVCVVSFACLSLSCSVRRNVPEFFERWGVFMSDELSTGRFSEVLLWETSFPLNVQSLNIYEGICKTLYN